MNPNKKNTMKNLITAFLMSLTVMAVAQDFEGTINWSIRTEITDPKMKAQMEEAQKRMNDPAMQAQMKELEKQMQDPQFKAMMESNPQMKAQMEKMMTMANNGNMEAMIPKGMIVKVKNGNTLTKLDGGMFNGDLLYLKEKGLTYQLDRENKTYAALGSAAEEGNTMKAVVTKTSESAKVAGYTCQKYKVEMTENGKTITQYVWATSEIKGIDMNGMYNQGIKGKGSPYFNKDIDGVPLKMEMRMPEMNMTMEATSIKRETLASSEFTIPATFKEVKGM